MGKYERECITCKTHYEYCTRCSEFDHLPKWMWMYCSDNCRTIFNVATDYHAGDMNKEEAMEKLSNCDLSKREQFNDSVARVLDKLFEQESSDAKVEKVVANEISEELPLAAEVSTEIKDTKNFKKMRYEKSKK